MVRTGRVRRTRSWRVTQIAGKLGASCISSRMRSVYTRADWLKPAPPKHGPTKACPKNGVMAAWKATLRHVVEHDVDYHAGDADVEPNGERPAGDLAVLIVPGAQAAAQRDDGEHGDRRRQNGVRQQDAEVNRAQGGAFMVKGHGAHLRVIDQVAHQEEAGGGEGGLHDAAVLVDSAAANQQVAAHQEHRGERVQRGIDGGQQGDHEGSLCSWRMSWRSFLGKPSSLER